jgi:hypothetical protein
LGQTDSADSERAAQLGRGPIGAGAEDVGQDRLLAAGRPQGAGQWHIHGDRARVMLLLLIMNLMIYHAGGGIIRMIAS